MASNQNKSPKPHAIMIALHLQGHINPLVNLALKLASKGFSITFAHLDFIHNRISKSQHNTTTGNDIFAQAKASGLDIHYTTINDGMPVDFNRDVNVELYLENFLYKFPDKVDEFMGKIVLNSHSGSDYFLIADTFSTWPEKIAKKYGLVNVSFWTEPALVFSLYYHLELLRKNGHVPVNGKHENVDYIPGIRSVNTKDFISYFHDSEVQILHKICFGAFDAVKSADFILCNTVQELEEETISALQQKQPFYAIGPLFQPDFSKNSIATSLWRESNPTEWLNSKPAGSVLYVSFGSLAKADKNMLLEIAGGLLLSGVNFIWVIRPGIVESDDDGDGILPKGFEVNTRDRGLIVPWCTQNEVLLNPAIGGFLTHCGWNSILESIWCGVPMICYPLAYDQPTNRKLVVDDWKMGINLCDAASITRDEVAEKIVILMSAGKRSDELRQEVGKVRKTLENALNNDGSSERNFDCFVQDVLDELNKRSIVAKEYKILNVSFWTEPALVFAIDYHLDLLREKGHFPSKGDNQGDDLIDFIQGVPPIKSKDLMSYLQETDITTITHQIVIKAFQQAKFADFILINSVNELERETISSLNQKQPTYAIGPINFTIDFTKTIVPKSLWSEKDCTQWLSPKSPGSVLYISFGSLAEHNKQLAEEMAYGLLLSEVEFIWVMKEDNDVLPDGFKNEMGNKGLIVSWCNQNAVISNPAVGGFVTHCGWNSILESIWCGVPMICFPLFADQPSNRKLVVDDWKIGINLCDGVSVSKEEVAEKVKQLMIGERSKELRREMEKVRTIVHKALGQNGSTNRNFDQFLKDLRSKVDANS